MQYTPKSTSEIAAMRLKPEGNYAFEVATAEDTVSKSSGKDMLKVVLNCFDANGTIFSVTDYLVPGTQYGDRKVFEFASSIGMAGKYATGQMSAEDVLGKGGWCKVKVGKTRPKADGSGEYPAKNEVAWYLEGEPKAKGETPKRREAPEHVVQNLPAPTAEIADTDVPF
jgi:hypothetical protein